jgi:poly(A) polymerase
MSIVSPTLPAAAWRGEDGLVAVVSALADEHGGPRIVGGAVRDGLLGQPVTDVDLATPLLPDAVVDRLEAVRIKAIPTGLDHGTITAVANSRNYEITTLRRDVSTDGRRATVAFSTDWREDAARRDFTINALYADPKTGEVFDYFGGLADLQSKIIRFIGDADQRIAEDFLRILRYFRFLARFGGNTVDDNALRACAAGAHGLTALSRERIAQELLKIIMLPDPVFAIGLMIENGIFTPFLPELSANALGTLQRLVDREVVSGFGASLPARLVTLLPHDATAIDKVAARLKLSNKIRESLAQRANAPLPTSANIRALAYTSGTDCARDVAMLFASDQEFAPSIAEISGWTVPNFTVKGSDLISRGLTAGPTVAKTLRAVEEQWIAEGFPGTPRIDAIADQSVAAALLAAKNA